MSPTELLLTVLYRCSDVQAAAALIGAVVILLILCSLRETLIQLIDDPADTHDPNPAE
jgi:hypothetical protein